MQWIATVGRDASFIGFLLSFIGAAQADFLPPNLLYLQDDPRVLANMNEAEFNQLVDQVIDFYGPYAEIFGAKLSAEKFWDSPTVNAFATQKRGKWIIEMYGGLARRSEITADGFVLVACHEMGHHFGGFPLKGTRWAAGEAQADYYASQTCAKNIWGRASAENAKFRSLVHPLAKEKCDQSWSSEADQNLCYRVSEAGSSLGKLLAALGNESHPRFETPDPTEVSGTRTDYPSAQCRFDTYYIGGLCKKGVDPHVIPGLGHPAGQDSPEAEEIAAQQSCYHSGELGRRPRCWFKPRNSD